MKKFLAAAVLLGIFGSTAISTSAVTTVTPTTKEERGKISVNTTAYKEVAPDVADLSIVVTTYDSKSMQKATTQNKEISGKVYTELKAMINSEHGDYIKTSDFNAGPEYKYVNNKSIFDRYKVSNSILIHTKSIDKLGTMIDKAIALGATNVGNLTFSFSAYDSECEKLLSEASEKAYKQANAALRPASTSTAGISNIYASCGGNNAIMPRAMQLNKTMAVDAAGEAEQMPTVIEQGFIKINATVNATYWVK